MAEVSFKDLVLDGTEQYATQKKDKSKPVFEVVANSGADFAIRRTVGKSNRLMVMLVSQEQYYVKNERTGEVATLDYKSLTSFLSGCGDIKIHCLWLDEFENTKQNRTLLMDIIKKRGFKETATSGLWQLDCKAELNRWNSRSTRFEECSKVAMNSSALTKSVSKLCKQSEPGKRSVLKDSISALAIIESAYSLDEARAFAERLAACSADEPIRHDVMEALLDIRKERRGITVRGGYVRYSGYGYGRSEGAACQISKSGETVSFRFSTFLDYVFEQSAKEGFAGQMNEWLVLWKDTLLMQIVVYGDVIEKYPENLLSLHHILCARTVEMKRELQAEAWEMAEKRMAVYDWNPGDEELFITHPHESEDVLGEARMQSNCVASYLDSVVEGRTLILFCRRKDEPERSHLTIEVSGCQPTLRQVKARFNREASDDDLRFLAKWCTECGIDQGRYGQRMRLLD